MTRGTRDHDVELPGEREVARAYRDAAHASPPPALDAKILAAARAVGAPTRRFASRWAIPISVAAVVVLSVGVVLRLLDDGTLDPAALRLAESEPAASHGSPPPAAMIPAPPAETPGSTPAQSAPPAELRKHQAPAARTPPRSRAEKRESPAGKTTNAAPSAGAQADGAPPLNFARERQDALAPAAPHGQTNRLKAETAAAVPRAAKGRVVAADIVAVSAGGEAGAYQFSVGIRSVDEGCVRYADWWEVVSADGRLLYRHVLNHSHVDEQPFTTRGGPVPVQPDTLVWIRAHMRDGGYGGTAFVGSVSGGFSRGEPAPAFAAALATQPPRPDGCAF